LVKQAKTQSGDVSQLLTGGVRYLDIRLSYLDDIWYTKHNYISGEFESIALNIISFLESNQGEFLILDFQHINGVSYDSLEDYMLFFETRNAFYCIKNIRYCSKLRVARVARVTRVTRTIYYVF
jgi:hypothetical protein